MFIDSQSTTVPVEAQCNPELKDSRIIIAIEPLLPIRSLDGVPYIPMPNFGLLLLMLPWLGTPPGFAGFFVAPTLQE
jgi:hypothetical protein